MYMNDLSYLLLFYPVNQAQEARIRTATYTTPPWIHNWKFFLLAPRSFYLTCPNSEELDKEQRIEEAIGQKE